jgi:hypothetical protein
MHGTDYRRRDPQRPGSAVLRRARHPPVANVDPSRYELCGTQSHEYELYVAVEDIDHSRTKTNSPQTTDVIDEAFQWFSITLPFLSVLKRRLTWINASIR